MLDRWDQKEKKGCFCLDSVFLDYLKDEVKIDNTMSQSLFFCIRNVETLVHMAKTRVWYAILDCSSTKLALLWAILNLSYTDFCWCKSGHRALKTGSHPGRKQSWLSVCWRACWDRCCLRSGRCRVGERIRGSKVALDNDGGWGGGWGKGWLEEKLLWKGKACLTTWPLEIFTILPSIPRNKGKFGGN